MNIKFTCPNCLSKLNIAPKLIGKKGRCPKCGKSFIIASSDERPEERATHPSSITGAIDENQQGFGDLAESSKTESIEPSRLPPKVRKRLDQESASEIAPEQPPAQVPQSVVSPYRTPLVAAISTGILVIFLFSYLFVNRGGTNRNQSANPSSTVTPVENSASLLTETGKQKQPFKSSTQVPASRGRSFNEAALIPNETVGLIVIHPQEFLKTRLGNLLRKTCGEEDLLLLGDVFRRTRLKATEIERLTLVYSQDFVDAYTAKRGLAVPDRVVRTLTSTKLREAMLTFGLGFMNYQDTFGCFPRADGDGLGSNTGLSWRVHLLPFLGQGVLYTQFHLEEAWDSEHNQTLIPKMPSIFQSPAVIGEGKTSIHVLTGENTLFYGKQGRKALPRSKEATNSILAVVAPAETAEIWTKPGGLPADPALPKSFAKLVSAGPLLTAFADFTVRELELSKDQTQFVMRPLQPPKANEADGPISAPKGPAKLHPTLVLTLMSQVEAEAIAKAFIPDSKKQTQEGQVIFADDEFAIWQSDDRTFVYGPIDSVTEMITTRASGKIQSEHLVSQLNLGADYSASIDVASQWKMLEINRERLGFRGSLPEFFGFAVSTLNAVKLATIHLSAEGNDSEPVMTINLELSKNASADPSLRSVVSQPLPPLLMEKRLQEYFQNEDQAKAFAAFNKELFRSIVVNPEGDVVRFRIAPGSNSDRLLDLLKPALINVRSSAKN